jgi:Uma2 family endonuclease
MSVRERASSNARQVTAEDLRNMPDEPGMQFEINEGILVQVPGASFGHHLVVMAILRLLDAFVTERDLGYVMPDGFAYLLRREPDVLRIPDVSFMAKERVPANARIEGYWHGAPDLAVEVVSPGDDADELHDKVRQYLEAGTRMVWVAWPKWSSISVHVEVGQSTELIHDAILDGGDVLPGFSVLVADIFAQRNALDAAATETDE